MEPDAEIKTHSKVTKKNWKGCSDIQFLKKNCDPSTIEVIKFDWRNKNSNLERTWDRL